MNRDYYLRFNQLAITLFLFVSTITIPNFSLAQVSITTNNYSQGFGTADLTGWTDNSTFAGWYAVSPWVNHLDIDGVGLPTNTGGFYSYECNANNDVKIGSRPSGGTGTIRYGVVFQNNTGTVIESISMFYTGFQLSLAQNNGNINQFTVDYTISAVDPGGITTGTFTGIGGLTYSAPNSDPGPGTSAQLAEYPCTFSSTPSACIDITLPVGHYFVLRWTDINDPANDHHMAIDNVNVYFHFDNACSITLPVELVNFDAVKKEDQVLLQWQTLSEINSAYFEVEKSIDNTHFYTLGTMSAAGNSNLPLNYQLIDPQAQNSIIYYRLKSVDNNGDFYYSQTVALTTTSDEFLIENWSSDDEGIYLQWTNSEHVQTQISLIDINGRTISNSFSTANTYKINSQDIAPGIYFLRISNGIQSSSKKVIISR